MNIGRAIVELRKEKDLSQGELAEGTGISHSYLSQIENNKKDPSTELIKKLSQQLGQPTGAMLLYALDDTDVAPEKVDAFNALSPILKELMKNVQD